MTRRLSAPRVVALVVVVLAFVLLSVLALAARSYEPARPAVAGSALPGVSFVTPRQAAPIAASTPIAVAGRTITNDAAAPAAPKAAPLPTGTPTNDTPVPLRACELGLAVPTQQAGLANLTPLVPLFGPFSPEAFAMVPAFAPGFPLVGPLIISGGAFLAENPELTDAAYTVLHPLETQGYATIAPFYEPVRPQVLAGEAQLASAIAPQVETFASLPGATCFPAALALILGS